MKINLVFSVRGTNLKPFMKSYSSAGVMGRYCDRTDGTSSLRLLGWTADVSAGLISNLRYLTRLHDPLQVSPSGFSIDSAAIKKFSSGYIG